MRFRIKIMSYATFIKRKLLPSQSRALLGLIRRTISVESKKLQISHENSSASHTYREDFASRHIGINKKQEAEMLKMLNINVCSNSSNIYKNLTIY